MSLDEAMTVLGEQLTAGTITVATFAKLAASLKVVGSKPAAKAATVSEAAPCVPSSRYVGSS